MTPLLGRNKTRRLVKRLNRSDRLAIDASWELVWLSALSSVGLVQHEPQLSGTSSPDVLFKSSEIEFLADVATVSDANYEEENPIDSFRREMEVLRNELAPQCGFQFHVDSKHVGAYRNSKVKLALPPRAELADFLRENFSAFFRALAECPDHAARHSVTVGSSGQIHLVYDPNYAAGIAGGGWRSFDVPYSLQRNPIANALVNKRNQLWKSGFRGIKGIVLCDGGCSALSSRMYSPDAFPVSEIISGFLKQSETVAFVIVAAVTTNQSLFQRTPRIGLEILPFCAAGLDSAVVDNLRRVFESALPALPDILRTPDNALARMKHGWPVPPQWGDYFGYTEATAGKIMDPMEIKLSAATLTALLSGKIDAQQFRQAIQPPSSDGKSWTHPLIAAIEEGRRLEFVKLEEIPGQDDDMVVLRFGGFDPARVSFCTPSGSI